MITAASLRRWAEQICQLSTGGRAETATALGVTAAITAHRDYALVDPVPDGAKRMRIFDDLKTHSKLDYLDLELLPPGLTLEALQAELGPGRTSVRTSPYAPHDHWFEIQVDGAPGTCDVYASLKDPPTAASTSTMFRLRRNPSPAPRG